MKVTKSQLKRIIKEEVKKIMRLETTEYPGAEKESKIPPLTKGPRTFEYSSQETHDPGKESSATLEVVDQFQGESQPEASGYGPGATWVRKPYVRMKINGNEEVINTVSGLEGLVSGIADILGEKHSEDGTWYFAAQPALAAALANFLVPKQPPSSGGLKRMREEQLKQIIKEEIKTKLDEMAWSAEDLEAAEAGASTHYQQSPKEAQRDYEHLVGVLAGAFREAGKLNAVSNLNKRRQIAGGSIPWYDPTFATLWKLISKDAVEKFGVKPADIKLTDKHGDYMGAFYTNHPDEFNKRRLRLKTAFYDFVDFAEVEQDRAALNNSEPYISLENAEQMKAMLDKVKWTVPEKNKE
jgi:hypothetical protein